MPGWGAGVGTQALVILVSHLASPQYVLLLSSAAKSVCQGKQCYEAGKGKRRGLERGYLVLFQPTYTVHTSSPVSERDHSRYFGLIRNKKIKEKS